MKRLLILVIATALSMFGCSEHPLRLGAEQVEVSQDAPPKVCKLIGQVSGAQGNEFTAPFTTNVAMELGAMNSLRNSAHKMGANYIRLLSGRASLNSSKNTVIYVGNAYACKE